MIRADLLKLLICPESRSPLSAASSEMIARLNAAIARRQLKNRADRTLETPLTGGLLRADQVLVYPIVDEIPLLLADEAILLDQPALATG